MDRDSKILWGFIIALVAALLGGMVQCMHIETLAFIKAGYTRCSMLGQDYHAWVKDCPVR